MAGRAHATAGVVELATEDDTRQWYEDAASYWKVRQPRDKCSHKEGHRVRSSINACPIARGSSIAATAR